MKLTAQEYNGGLVFTTKEFNSPDNPSLKEFALMQIGGASKIIAQTPNLNLEGIPYVELEEDVEQFTLEQIRRAIDMAQEQVSVRFYPNEYEFKYTENQIIQSLQPKIESVEVEWLHRDEPHLNGTSTITDRPITYQKDGRTYLKVKSINYKK